MSAILDWLTSPAALNAIAAIALAVWQRVSSSQASARRWARITTLIGQHVAELAAEKGTSATWETIALETMRAVVEEVEADPGVKSLTPSEIERAKFYAMALAKRRVAPGARGSSSPRFPGAR